MRRLITIAALLLATAGLLAPAAAEGATSTLTVEATGRITFYNPQDCAGEGCAVQPLYAPVSPLNPDCGLSTCPTPDTFGSRYEWAWDGGAHPHGIVVPCRATEGTVTRSCSIRAEGIVGQGHFNRGAFCGYGQGPVDVWVTVGSRVFELTGPTLATVHVGPTLAWRLREAGVPSSSQVGEMVMTLLEAEGGDCGLDPTDGFAPATGYRVAMELHLTNPL